MPVSSFPRNLRQVPVLMRKNFLVWLSSPIFLFSVVLIASVGFLLVFWVSVFLLRASPNVPSEPLYPPSTPRNHLQLGPRAICNNLRRRPAESIVYTNPGPLADQVHFNLQSVHSTESPNLVILDLSDDWNDFNPAQYESVAIRWKQRESHNITFPAPTSQLNVEPTQTPSDGAALTHTFTNFDYLLFSGPSNTWLSEAYAEYYHPYENNALLVLDGISMSATYHALVEFSIAQLNGFHKDFPLCDFPHDFDFNVVSYPRVFLNEYGTELIYRSAWSAHLIFQPMFLLFMIPLCLFVVTTTVAEKVNHLHASLIVIGISTLNMHLAALLTHLIVFTPPIIIVAIICWTQLSFPYALFTCIFYYAIIASIVTFARLIASFFTKQATAQVGIVGVYLVFFGISTLLSVAEDKWKFMLQYVLFLSNIHGIVRMFSQLWYGVEIKAEVYDFTIVLPGAPHLSLFGQIGLLLFQSFAMLLCGVYFDSILSTSKYHIPKSWTFPISGLIRWVAKIFRCTQLLSGQSIHAMTPKPQPRLHQSPSPSPSPSPSTLPLFPKSPSNFNLNESQPSKSTSTSSSSSPSEAHSSTSSTTSGVHSSISSSTSTSSSPFAAPISSSTNSLAPSSSFSSTFDRTPSGSSGFSQFFDSKENPFDAIGSATQRYFLQYGRDYDDRLSPEEEYLFQGSDPTLASTHTLQFALTTTTHTAHTLLTRSTQEEPQNLFQSIASEFSLNSLFNNTTPSSRNVPHRDELSNSIQLLSLQDMLQENPPEPSDIERTNATTHTSAIIQYPSQKELDNPAVSMKNVTKSFDNRPACLSSCLDRGKPNALDSINLRFYRGQIHSIIGKNASGKSVLLSVLGGMIAPDSGSVFMHLPDTSGIHSDGSKEYTTPLEQMMENPLAQYRANKSLSRAEKTEGKEFYSPTYGICWQEDTLFEELTCIQNMELFSLFKESVSGISLTQSQRFEEIYQLLDMAQLSEKFDGKEHATVSSLSGGQKRKLNLAIALLHNPSLVLLDHCTNGADVSSQAIIWNMLEVQKKKRCIILSTHNFSEALIGDRISVIKDGQLVCSGTALFLKEHYKVGEYIFTIDKEPFVNLNDQFLYEFATKTSSSSSSSSSSWCSNSNSNPSIEPPPPDINGSISEDLQSEGFLSSQTSQATVIAESASGGSLSTTLKSSSSTKQSRHDGDNDDNESAPNTTTVDLHTELISTPIEEIGFDIKSMLTLLSDSPLKTTYAIQSQHESNIPLLLDYLESSKGRLRILGTSLTTTSLDDVFRSAHGLVQQPGPSLKPQLTTPTSTTATEFSTSTHPLDSLNSLQSNDISSPDLAFTDEPWYKVKLPETNSKIQFFFRLLFVFFKKRLSMLTYRFYLILPLYFIVIYVAFSPCLIYFTFSSHNPPIPLNLQQVYDHKGRIQYFAPSPALPSNYVQPNESFSAQFTSSANTAATSTITANHSLILPLASFSSSITHPEINKESDGLLDLFCRSIAGTPHNTPQQTTSPVYNKAQYAMGAIQHALFEQSMRTNRRSPYAASLVLHSVHAKYDDAPYQLVGPPTYALPKPFPPSAQRQDNNISTPQSTPDGITGFKATIFVNTTSPLPSLNLVAQIYATITTLHVNLKAHIQPRSSSLSTLPITDQAQLLQPANSLSPYSPQLLQPQSTEFVPKSAHLRPAYTTNSSLSFTKYQIFYLPTLLYITTLSFTSIAGQILAMYLVSTNFKERQSKVILLHRLAAKTHGFVAYLVANVLFDVVFSICTTLFVYFFFTISSRVAIPYLSDASVKYLDPDDSLTAIRNVSIYLICLAISLPFQGYTAQTLASLISSDPSPSIAYIISTMYSIMTPVIGIFVEAKFGKGNVHFLAQLIFNMCPVSSIVSAGTEFNWVLWKVEGDPLDQYPFTVIDFDRKFCTPIIMVIFGSISLLLYHVDWSVSSFYRQTGSLYTSLFTEQATHPKLSVKGDRSAAQMKVDILSLRSRTGNQGHDQYSITFHGLRKVFIPNHRYRCPKRVLALLNEIFNPIIHWWRNSPAMFNEDQRKLEEFKLKLLRMEKRRARKALAEKQRLLRGGHPNSDATLHEHDEHDDDQAFETDDDDDDDDLGKLVLSTKSTPQPTIALNDLYLAVRKNSVTCLCAPNGNGKTQVMSILTNEQNPSSSTDPFSMHTAFIDNSNILNSESTLSKISYCPQANRLNMELSAKEHFKLYATLYGIDPDYHEALVNRVLHSLDLVDVAYDPCSTYSPGKLRLVQIGICLLCNSDIVLLDEFSNFLDPITRSNVHELLKSLAHTRTILLASHMAEEIEQLSDDIAIMNKGSLITIGSKSMLKSSENAQAIEGSSLFYTVNVRVESLQVMISVQSFLLSTLSRIPPPQFPTNSPSSMSTAQKRAEQAQQFATWTKWIAQCREAGVKLVSQQHNRFTVHVSTDLYPLSTLFVRLEQCKSQCGTHLVRYTASQPTVDQLFISVIERSKRAGNSSSESDKLDMGHNVVI